MYWVIVCGKNAFWFSLHHMMNTEVAILCVSTMLQVLHVDDKLPDYHRWKFVSEFKADFIHSKKESSRTCEILNQLLMLEEKTKQIC